MNQMNKNWRKFAKKRSTHTDSEEEEAVLL
jgi:hypothetical protein